METNNFTYPPPQSLPGNYSLAFEVPYGEPREWTWTDNYTAPLQLWLIQETAFVDNNYLPLHYDTLATDITNKSYLWNGKPSQNLNLSLSNLFWLAMYLNSESDDILFKSQYFNVTDSPSASSSTISTSTSSSSSTTASSPTSSSTLAAQPNSAPTSSSTPVNTAKSHTDHVALGAGLGVGLGGAALIIGVLAFFFLGRKRKSRNQRKTTPEVYQLAENDHFSR
ncbi:hypothetical protein BDR22DRAFT_977192 [Usnea florida]